MSIFAEILCKHFPNIPIPSIDSYSITKLKYSNGYSTRYYNIIKLVYHIYFMPYRENYDKSFINKFNLLYDIVLNNIDIPKYEKDFLLMKFCSAQLVYSNFRKIARLFKFKYSRKFEIDCDLCFRPLNNLKEHIMATVLENKIIYKFRISDLINIINESLSYSPYFFAEPYNIKNPYTNVPFSIANLYNIYFKIKKTNYIMPLLFHQYFMSNFDLLEFKHNNECLIRDKAIDNFVEDSSIDEKHEYILKMFYIHHSCILFSVDSHFPKLKLVTTFYKYLKHFLKELYSLNPHIKEKNRIHIEYNLTLFSQLNPDFGKKIWVRKRRQQQSILYYTFNDDVIESSDLITTYYTRRNRYSRYYSLLDDIATPESDEVDYIEEPINTEDMIDNEEQTDVDEEATTAMNQLSSEEGHTTMNQLSPVEATTTMDEREDENINESSNNSEDFVEHPLYHSLPNRNRSNEIVTDGIVENSFVDYAESVDRDSDSDN